MRRNDRFKTRDLRSADTAARQTGVVHVATEHVAHGDVIEYGVGFLGSADGALTAGPTCSVAAPAR